MKKKPGGKVRRHKEDRQFVLLCKDFVRLHKDQREVESERDKYKMGAVSAMHDNDRLKAEITQLKLQNDALLELLRKVLKEK